MSNEILSVILGGGAGTRLHPLTASRSKPAVPIAGKYRLVDIPISNCLHAGMGRMFVLTQFNSASLNRHIKNTYHFSAFSKAFVDILAAEQTPDNPKWYQGTADAVRQGLRHIRPFPSDFVLILSGDQLYQMDFLAMLDNHFAKHADISIGTIPVTAKDASDFGILKVNEGGYITSFVEKPKSGLENWVSDTGDEMKHAGKVYLASMGIYIFNRDLLFDILQIEKKDATDFGKEIIPESLEKYKVVSYQYDGYWTDIGNIHSFFEANLELTDEIPKFNLFDNDRTIYTRPRMLPPAKISGTSLVKTLIAEGSIIHSSRIENSVIGIRSRLGYESNIISAYIMGNDYYETLTDIEKSHQAGLPLLGIGSRCHIQNAIVDKNCRIGDDVIITGGAHLENQEHALYTVKDGIVVVRKEAVLPNGFTI